MTKPLIKGATGEESLLTQSPAEPQKSAPKKAGKPTSNKQEQGVSDAADDRLAIILDRFRLDDDGIDVEALARAFLALEERMGSMVALPGKDASDKERRTLFKALGVPETPEAYDVSIAHDLFERDPEIEARLHAEGFTPRQVQLVYDLAAERMMPLMEEIVGDLKADSDLGRLVDRFGGEEKWQETSRQMLAWGKKHLPADALEAMTRSYDGVIALYRMMEANQDEPKAMRPGPKGSTEEDDLNAMVRDPRYWRDKDPAQIKKVTDGFKRLYPDG